MQALRITTPHDFGIVNIEIPAPTHNQSLIRVKRCGICGSDLDIINGVRPMEVTRYPLIMGHEFSGEIEVPGEQLEGFKPGDKVAINTIAGCGECANCRRGWICHCLKQFDQLGCTSPGGMAEFVAVRNDLIYKLPKQMELSVAALAEPAGCAAHGVSKAMLQPGDDVVILGCGPIGALALQVARLFSPRKLILVEVDERKFDLARTLGATDVIHAGREEVTESVMRLTNGRGAQGIIDCTGNLKAILDTADFVATKGRIVIIGVPDVYDLSIHFMKLLFQDAIFRPSNGYTIDIWLWVLNLLQSGKIDAETIITRQLTLNEVRHGFELLEKRDELNIKVMLEI